MSVIDIFRQLTIRSRRKQIKGGIVRSTGDLLTTDRQLVSERFPRSSQYHPDWVLASASGGANALWLTEWLTSKLDLRSGMKLLDLGCGRAASSIFLRREFGVQVWATDLWFSAAENIQRVRDAGDSINLKQAGLGVRRPSTVGLRA